MGTVRTDTSLHPKTVQKIAKNAVMISKNKKSSNRARNSKITRYDWYDGLDPLILAWVRENHIYYKRVEIVNSTTIVVHN